MKNSRTRAFVSVLFLTIASLFSTNVTKAQGYGQVSFDLFYNELSPYGYWDNDPNYGDIWYPSVGNDFRPYSSNGYWTMTQYGNTWVSNYPWGWGPFHYGRWVYTNHRGWGWTPGYEWGPAWVDWRSGNGYYGWAPMAPRLSINISIGLPIDLWIFAPSRRIYDRNIYRHSYYGRPNIYNNTTIINNTYIVNNNHYYGGPSRRDTERTTGRKVTVRDIRNSDKPGSSRVDNNSVSIYRPDRNSRVTSTSSRNTGVKRNERPTSSNSNRTDNRVSREMYIGKDGSSQIRERNDNSSVNNRESRIEKSNRPERVISGNERNRTPQRTMTNQETVNKKENNNIGRIENSRQIRTQSTQDQIPQRESRTQPDRSRNSGNQTTRQERRSTESIGTSRPQRVERNSNNMGTRVSEKTSTRSTSVATSSRGSR